MASFNRLTKRVCVLTRGPSQFSESATKLRLSPSRLRFVGVLLLLLLLALAVMLAASVSLADTIEFQGGTPTFTSPLAWENLDNPADPDPVPGPGDTVVIGQGDTLFFDVDPTSENLVHTAGSIIFLTLPVEDPRT